MIGRFILPLITLLVFYGESLFVHLFQTESWSGDKVIVPHFLVITLILICAFYRYGTALLFGFIFGFFFDIYYTEINGIYLILLPFMVVLTQQMMKVLHNNIIVLGIIAVVNLSILEVIVYYIYVILKRTNLTFMEFVDWRLWPTLVLNVVFYLIVSIPFKHYLVSRRKAWLGE
ncbi:rod shape-determining protein MreD [Rossellomorea marisflavi]